MSSWRAVAVVSLGVLVGGCSASVHYRSKNGRSFEELTRTAVHCEEAEAQTVSAAGAEVIGSISGKALMSNDHEVITEKAQLLAARKGGTHIVLTEKGEDIFTHTTPAQVSTDCVRYPDAVECRTVATPATMTTQARAKASFVVLRLERERWGALPTTLRPLPRDEGAVRR